MESVIATLVGQFEQGKLSRRQLIQNLTIAASAAAAVGSVPASAAESKVITATNFNHVSYQVKDYKKSRDFYAGLLGMKVTEDDGKQCRLTFGNNILIVRTRQPAPLVDHIAYTVANWDQEREAIEGEVKRRGLTTIDRGDPKASLHVLDPDGFVVQFGGSQE